MKPHLRVVNQMPLSELWDDTEVLNYERGRILRASEVGELLKTPGLRIVVADVGRPLEWVAGNEVFRRWKRDAKLRIVSPEKAATGFRLEDFPGEYAYIATEWQAPSRPPIVLLERDH